MKIHIQIISLLLTGFILSACSDFLDRNPLDSVSRETYYKDETEIKNGLVSTYRRLRSNVIGGMGSDAGNGSSLDMEALTDNAFTTGGFESFGTIAEGNISPSTGGVINSMWEHCWQGIASCNFFLDNLERSEVKGLLSDETYRRYRGEALFNRCYYYHLLVEHYGDIPWINTSVTADMPYLEFQREPKSRIVTEILKDINVAIEGLPLPSAGYTSGHAIKSSAIMLKVRILMANGRFSDAVTAAEELIKNPQNPHIIEPDYEGIFFNHQKNNREILFSIQYSGNPDGHGYDFYVASRMTCYPLGELALAYGQKLNGDPDPRLRMTMFVVGDPWVMNDKGGVGSSGTYTYPNGLGTFTYAPEQFPARLRIGGQTVPSTSTDGTTLPAWNLSWKKGVDRTIVDPRDTRGSAQHRVLMRYADLLLLYAEAKVEVAGGTTTDADALDAFNAIRLRPSVDMPEVTSLTRDLVRNERRVELAYEGIRLYDIMRWGIGKEVITTILDKDNRTVVGGKITSVSHTTNANEANENGNNGRICNVCTWQGNLWPIPQNVMNIMVPSAGWKQNAPY